MSVRGADIRAWNRLGQRGAVFGVALPKLGRENRRLKLLTADLAVLSGMDHFKKECPEQFLNVGIAEQNMIGIAAGLAMEGDVVFATTYASFIAVRSLEHVRQHLSYLQCNVKIIGSAAGVVAAKSGVSHWATEDLAFTRALPGMEVYSPCDALQAVKITEYIAATDRPAYVRLSGTPGSPAVDREDYEYIPGKLRVLKEGTGVCIIATGLMVSEALAAAELLREEGITPSVVDLHTVKPVDREGLKQLFDTHDLIVTVEEHNIVGGMGSAVAEVKALYPAMPRQVFLGFPDAFARAGSQRFLWEQVGLTAERIAERIRTEYAQ